MMACNVDFKYAAEVALRILKDNGVWERKLGLCGIWGSIVRQWLDEVLPVDAAEVCSGKVHIAILRLPFRKEYVSEFHSKEDLINACLASAHIPWLMDGKAFAMFRGWPCVDGSIASHRKETPEYLKDSEHVLCFDYVEDEKLMAGSTDFMKLMSPQGVLSLIEVGFDYAQRMHHTGSFTDLDFLKKEGEENDLPKPQQMFTFGEPDSPTGGVEELKDLKI